MIEAILNEKYWMLDEAFALKWQELIDHRFAAGKDLGIQLNADPEKTEMLAMDIYGTEWDAHMGMNYFMTPKGKVARIPLMGVMTYEGGLCSYGTKALAAKVDAVGRQIDYIGSVVVSNTPGGAGTAVEVLQTSIKDRVKPVVTLVEQSWASAGVWSTIYSDKIFALSERFAMTGSIGGLMVYENNAKALEEKGIVRRIIRAPQSTNKMLVNPIETLTEEIEADVLVYLKKQVDYFISDVKDARGSQLKDDGKVYTGATYDGKEAVTIGLIDAIGTMDDAIQTVIDLSGKTKKSNSKINFSSNTSKMSLFSKLFPKGETVATMSPELSQIFGEVDGNTIELKVNDDGATKLQALESFITQSNTAYGELETELTTANSTIETHESTIATQKLKIEELGKAPATNHTEAPVKADAVTGDPVPVETNENIPSYREEEQKVIARREARNNAKF